MPDFDAATAALFYGEDATAAPATERAPSESQVTANKLWSDSKPAARDTAPAGQLYSNEHVTPDVQASVQEAVERGSITPAQAATVAANITHELVAIGLQGSDQRAFYRDIQLPPLDEAAAGRQRGEAMSNLSAKYGDKGPALLQAANAHLRKVAPNMAARLSQSRAGNDWKHIDAVIQQYQRSKRS